MFADSIVRALRSIVGEGNSPLHEPRFAGNEQRYVLECLASTYVSSVGAYVERFEKELAAYTGARRAVAVVNGTAALQVALQLAGVRADDEVIVPALTFVATANAVRYLNAVPHFADSEEATLGLDPRALRDWLKSVAEPTGDAYRNRQTGRRLARWFPCTLLVTRAIWMDCLQLRTIIDLHWWKMRRSRWEVSIRVNIRGR